MRRSIIQTMASSVVVSVLTIVVGIATARVLGPEDRGTYTTVTLAAAMVTMLATLGGSEVLVIRGRPEVGPSYRRSTWLISVCASLIFAVPLIPYLAGAVSLDATRAVIAVGACVVGTVGTLGLADQIAEGSVTASNIIRLTPVTVQVLVFGAVWALGIPITVDGALALYLATITAPALVALWLLLRDRRGSSANAGLRPTGRAIVPIWIGRVAQVLSTRVDILILAYLVPAAAVAQYAIAVSTAMAATSVSTSIGLLMLQNSRAAESAGPAASAVGLVASLAAAGVGPFAIALLYGGDYLTAARLAPLAAILGFTQLLYDLTMRVLQRSGHHGIASSGALCLIVLHLAALVTIVPRAGLAGALLALAGNQLLLLLVTHVVARRRGADLSWSHLSPTAAFSDLKLSVRRRRRSRREDEVDVQSEGGRGG